MNILKNLDGKNSSLKQRIIALCINDGDYSLADLSKELDTSIPTTTKLVGELVEDGLLMDMGKVGTNGGRRPSIYGLNPSAGYFVGVNIRRKFIGFAVTDFKGTLVDFHEYIDFKVENSEESFRQMCRVINDELRESGIDPAKVLAYGFNLTGRVNNETGYCFSYFIGEDKPIASVLEDELGKPAFVENDSRAMTYGEYICGTANGEKNMLYLNVAWGLGMGMIVDGKLSYGKSGFSGEIGHFPLLNNNQICHCGKMGCLETGASGSAVNRIFLEKTIYSVFSFYKLIKAVNILKRKFEIKNSFELTAAGLLKLCYAACPCRQNRLTVTHHINVIKAFLIFLTPANIFKVT